MNREQIQLAATRARHETMRWLVLVTLNVARPNEAPLAMVHSVIKAVFADATELEVACELDYLKDRDLITVRKDLIGNVLAKIDRYGSDVVQYMVECEPGIARPQVGT